MRVDAHQHFWRLGRYDYVWMSPELRPLQRDFGPDDLQPALERHGIQATVLVQTVSSLAETHWFLELARAHSFIAGVVGWVDLTDPDVGAVLDELTAHQKLVGVRHQVHDEPDLNWLGRPDVLRGLTALEVRGLTYDLLIRPQHLAVSLEVARRLPGLRLVVDHIAKPRIAQRAWDGWADGLAQLGRCPNVWCKLSGMITEADWACWTPDDLRPYIHQVLDVFGPERVMFGSDWPVCLLAGSYDRVVEATEINTAHLTAAERKAIWGLNALCCYRLSVNLQHASPP